jgi:hypothetical protein
MSIPMSDYYGWLHGRTRAADGSFAGTVICQSGAEASELYLDAGKTYSDEGGQQQMGVHVLVTVDFATTVSIRFDVVHNTGAPTTAKVIGSRVLLLAELVAGKHYFIPFFAKDILRYLGVYATPSTNPTAGALCMWVGPGPDGAE